MSFIKTIAMPNCCPADSAPVSICEGYVACNEAGTKSVIMLTMKNVGEKAVTATGVRINIYDADGCKIGKTIKCWYTNLSVEPGKKFGMKTRIPVPAQTRYFEVEVGALKYIDGSVWQTGTVFDSKTRIAVAPGEEKETEISRERAAERDVSVNENIIAAESSEVAGISPEEIALIEAEKQEKKASRNRLIGKIALIAGGVIVLAIAAYLIVNVVIPGSRYNSAVAKMEAGNYEEAMADFADMGDYKDAKAKISECITLKRDADYQNAIKLMDAKEYDAAQEILRSLNGYKDSNDKAEQCDEATKEERYQNAETALAAGRYDEAKAIYETMLDYKESADHIKECGYQLAVSALNAKEYDKASTLFDELGNYKDSIDQEKECKYQIALGLYNEKKFDDSNQIFEELGSYKDSAKKIHTHVFTDKITTEPTCTETGIRTYTCSCGKSYTEDVEALGHSYSDVKITKNPTCTSPGTKTLTCRCGDSKTESVPATGHTYTAQVTVQPTCTEAGITTYTCHCGDSYTEPIPANGHNYNDATCWEAPVCKVCGHQEGRELGHTTSKGYCKRCGIYIRDGEEWDSESDWREYRFGSDD